MRDLVDLRMLSFPAAYVEVAENFLCAREYLQLLHACALTPEGVKSATVDGVQLRSAMEACAARCSPAQPTSLQLLSAFSLARHGMPGLLSMTAETVNDALDVFLRFSPLVMPAFHFERRQTRAGVELTVTLRADFGPYSWLFCELGMGGFAQILPFVQDAKGGNRYRFAHRAGWPVESYRPLFGEHVQFEAGENVVVIDRSLLACRLVTRSRHTHAQMLSSIAQPSTALWVRQVEHMLARANDEARDMDLPQLARRLGVSARTLTRRLHEEGASLPQLQARVRMTRARRLLAEGRLNVAEVAHLVGYRDATSFARAYRRVLGTTPRAKRGVPS